MTKEQTIKVLQFLNAIYAGGNNDPVEQVTAWHLILGKYDFDDTMQAVIRYVENDTRQYASFPAVGVIVNEIRKAENEKKHIVNEVIVGISYGRTYDMISDKAKSIISQSQYDELNNMEAEQFSLEAGKLRQALQKKVAMLNG